MARCREVEEQPLGVQGDPQLGWGWRDEAPPLGAGGVPVAAGVPEALLVGQPGPEPWLLQM